MINDISSVSDFLTPSRYSKLSLILQHCNLDKVYLFDMMTKLFLMTDFVPLDLENFAICADMLDVFMDFACIYGDENSSKKTEAV